MDTIPEGGDNILLYTANYNRDKLGRITQKTETVQDQTTITNYSYDPAGRLKTVDKNGELTHYSYDQNGNRLNKTTDNETTTGNYDDQDRLISYKNCNYHYTDNGELEQKTCGSETTQYQYDVLGNLLSVQLADTRSIDYLIDGQNRRIGKKVNGVLVQGFLYKDPLKPIAELQADGTLKSRFIYADKPNIPAYMIKDSIPYRIISDHLGSPRLVVNAQTGEVIQKIDYDEFGNITQDTNPGFQPFGFAGGLYDHDTQLTRFGARDYDAESGRWTAKDPIGFYGSMNLYGYTANDPINRFDLNGLDWQYSQSTGTVTHVDANGNATVVSTEGYAGHGDGVNNPAMQGVENVGPIPQGTYDIGAQQNNVTNTGTTLTASMRLTPREGTDALGRAGFIIHGDNRAMNQTASQGCPILPRNVRDQIANSGDTTFTVVP